MKFSMVSSSSCSRPSISCSMRERCRFRLRTGIAGALVLFSRRGDRRGFAEILVRAILDLGVGRELSCDLILITSESSDGEISG
jgi:hypothetical protein